MRKLLLVTKGIVIGVCLVSILRHELTLMTLFPISVLLLTVISIILLLIENKQNIELEPSKDIDVTKLNIGDIIIHRDKGPIKVEGIKPHCGDYAVITKDNLDNHIWVYLKNCKLP